MEILPVHRLKIKWLLYIGRCMTEWEFDFIQDVSTRDSLSILQVDKLDEIYKKVRYYHV